MDAQKQRLELEPAIARDHDLAVDDAARRQGSLQRRRELREIAIQGLEVARLDERLLAVAEDEGAEPVPLRLEQPAVALWQRIGRLGEHRLNRWVERELHTVTVPDRGDRVPDPGDGQRRGSKQAHARPGAGPTVRM